MKRFESNLLTEMEFMEEYNLTPSDLLLIKILVLSKEDYGREETIKYFSLPYSLRFEGRDLKEMITRLKDKKIILSNYIFPEKEDKFYPHKVPFTKKFEKDFYRESLKMGEELYNVYPVSCIVNNEEFKLRRVSKKFNSLEEAFAKYAKNIKFNPDTHIHVIELIEKGKEQGYKFSTLDSFIIDYDWLNIEEMVERNERGGNLRML